MLVQTGPCASRGTLRWGAGAQELDALPGEEVKAAAVDAVVPFTSNNPVAEQALWRSDFFTQCTAPREAVYKVLTSACGLSVVERRRVWQVTLA